MSEALYRSLYSFWIQLIWEVRRASGSRNIIKFTNCLQIPRSPPATVYSLA